MEREVGGGPGWGTHVHPCGLCMAKPIPDFPQIEATPISASEGFNRPEGWLCSKTSPGLKLLIIAGAESIVPLEIIRTSVYWSGAEQTAAEQTSQPPACSITSFRYCLSYSFKVTGEAFFFLPTINYFGLIY